LGRAQRTNDNSSKNIGNHAAKQAQYSSGNRRVHKTARQQHSATHSCAGMLCTTTIARSISPRGETQRVSMLARFEVMFKHTYIFGMLCIRPDGPPPRWLEAQATSDTERRDEGAFAVWQRKHRAHTKTKSLSDRYSPTCTLSQYRYGTHGQHPLTHTATPTHTHSNKNKHTQAHQTIQLSCAKHMHTYRRTSMRADMPPYIRIYVHACMHACIHTYMRAYMRSQMHTYRHAHIQTYTHTCIQTYMRTNLHTCIHT
jgi:hypothetical protein